MDFLRSQPRLSFLYGGKPFAEAGCTVSRTEGPDGLTTVYRFPDGLQVTNAAVKRGDAYEWVNYFENTGDEPTGIISELWDCCAVLPMSHEGPWHRTKYMGKLEDHTAVYSPNGSKCSTDEFVCDTDQMIRNVWVGQIHPG